MVAEGQMVWEEFKDKDMAYVGLLILAPPMGVNTQTRTQFEELRAGDPKLSSSGIQNGILRQFS